RALLEELMAVSPADEIGASNICMRQGHLLLELGDYAAARSRYEEGLALRRGRGATVLVAWALVEAGHAGWLQGENAITQSSAMEALRLFQELGNAPDLRVVLESLAAVALAEGQKERAARLMGSAEALRLGWWPWWRRPRERIEEAVRAASLERDF